MASTTRQQSGTEPHEDGTGARPLASGHTGLSDRTRRILVPIMLAVSSLLMALAWMGHLRHQEWPFLIALAVCWGVVLPEYILNVYAIRMGYRVYSGAQMGAFNLCSGVVCVALVSRFVLGETLSLHQIIGFAVMFLAMLLIAMPGGDDEAGDGREAGR